MVLFIGAALQSAMRRRQRTLQAFSSHGTRIQTSRSSFVVRGPPRSGKRQAFPEIDRAACFGVAEADMKILKGQAVFIDRLLKALQAKGA